MSGNEDAAVGGAALFAAVSALAFHLAPDLELAPLDQDETPEAHACRLLGELEARGQVLVLDAKRLAEGLAVLLDDLDPTAAPVTVALSAIESLLGERQTLRRQVAAFKGRANSAQRQVAALEAELPPEPREFGEPLPAALVDDFAGKVAAAASLQLAFADVDGRELEGVHPLVVSDRNLQQLTGGRFLLNVPNAKVTGPLDSMGVELAAYVLLADGKVLAHTPRSDVLRVPPGQTLALTGDVVL